ncbi:hypothetical protein CJP72_09795 [Citrobacter sp. NCU1]|uniref:LysR family transcriptional regulator n=1 Tax=Citrobacter sp. NCU1 TaxID=2026683 RepID=UPI001390BB9F|nr:LysR family transcriptional regulator [Citrobacter sp. NCU1]NDO81048.1 hypothetical protein [Citrobacter sp. NCU1]
MNVKQLRYFCKVVEKNGINPAAAELQIGATTISMQIAALEKEMNNELFNRSTRPMTLTKFGQFVYQRSQEIIFNFDAFENDIFSYTNSESTSLNIGVIRSLIFNILPETIKQFTNSFGHIDINLKEGLSTNQYELLAEQVIDLGFVRAMEQKQELDNDFCRELILIDPLFAAVPKNHYLTRNKFITLKDFCNSPFITFPGNQKSEFSDTVVEKIKQNGLSPVISYKAREIHSALSFVAAGLGVTLVGKTVIDNNRQDIAFLPISDFHCNCYIYAIYRSKNTNPNIQHFLSTMKKVALN